MTGFELARAILEMKPEWQAKQVTLIGQIGGETGPNVGQRGSATLDHIERIEGGLLLVTEEQFTVK